MSSDLAPWLCDDDTTPAACYEPVYYDENRIFNQSHDDLKTNNEIASILDLTRKSLK